MTDLISLCSKADVGFGNSRNQEAAIHQSSLVPVFRLCFPLHTRVFPPTEGWPPLQPPKFPSFTLWAFHPQGSADQQQKTLPTRFLGKNYNCVRLVLVPVSGPNTRGDKDRYFNGPASVRCPPLSQFILARGSTWKNTAATTAMWRAQLLQARGGVLDTSGFSLHYRQRLKGRSRSGHPVRLHRPPPAARHLALDGTPLSLPKSPLAKKRHRARGHTRREQSSAHSRSVSGTGRQSSPASEL